jgi:hypothetical protein
MLSEDTADFLKNWSNQIEQIKGDELRDVYARFDSLFKVYERLFNETSNELVQKGRIEKAGGHKKSATENVVRYLGADKIIQGFLENNNDPDIDALYNVLPHFNIVFKNEEHYPEIDNDLRNDLQSKDHGVKVLAILKLIYFVRCNYVHARKDAQEYQRLLVEPIINLLRTLNTLLITELSK